MYLSIIVEEGGINSDVHGAVCGALCTNKSCVKRYKCGSRENLERFMCYLLHIVPRRIAQNYAVGDTSKKGAPCYIR